MSQVQVFANLKYIPEHINKHLLAASVNVKLGQDVMHEFLKVNEVVQLATQLFPAVLTNCPTLHLRHCLLVR